MLPWTARCLAAVLMLALFARATAAGPILLYDASTEQVLYAQDADQPWYPASLAKLMTAYLVFDAWKAGKVSKDTQITISAKAASQPKMRLALGAGKTLTFDEAIKALVIKSANDIAVAIAEAMSGSEEAFVAEMNATAARLGMTDTRYINASGLPGEGQHTTARDLALLTQALLKTHADELGVFSLPMAQVAKKTVATHNTVLNRVPGADGMKTGFTCSAGYNIVASATREGRRLVAIVLGEISKSKRAAAAELLLEHGFKTAGWKDLFPAPTLASLPGGHYDREAVRAENLEKRFKDCKDPEPIEAPGAAPGGTEAIVASTGAQGARSADSKSAAQQTRRTAPLPSVTKAATAVTTGSLADKPGETPLPNISKPSEKRLAAKPASKRRTLRRSPGDPYADPVFSLASP